MQRKYTAPTGEPRPSPDKAGMKRNPAGPKRAELTPELPAQRNTEENKASGNRAAQGPSENRIRQALGPEGEAAGQQRNQRVDERWGELPELVRGHFRDGGSDTFPIAYRAWIEAYYRRLAARTRR